MKKIINGFLGLFNLKIVRQEFLRESTRIAKEYFNGKPIKVAEVGVMKGENAKDLIKNLNIQKIYLIDPYEDTKEYPNSTNDEIIALNKLFKYSDKLEWVKEYSDDALNKIPSELDFIYIDGSHFYEQVKKDIVNYWNKLNKSGILAGHDMTHHQGVIKAVIEFCNEKNITPIIRGEDWIICKGLIPSDDYT